MEREKSSSPEDDQQEQDQKGAEAERETDEGERMKHKYYVTLTFFEYWVRVPSFAAWLLMNLPFIDMKVEPQTTNNR